MTIVNENDIFRAAREAGVKNGDILLVHSSLKSLGQVDGGADAVIDALLRAVGKDGTLVMPTLSSKNWETVYEDWHLDRPSDVGFITETFRKRPDALRSDNATHSVAAIGKYAFELTKEHGGYGPRFGIFEEWQFSYSSPWQEMYDSGAKVMFLGVTMLYNTFKHFIEYRMVERTLSAVKNDEDRAALRSRLWHYGRLDGKGVWPFHDAVKLQGVLEEQGMVGKVRCGNAEILCVEIRQVVETADALFEKEPEKWYAPGVIEWLKDAAAKS